VEELTEGFSSRYREGIFSAISAGFFFVLIGAIFITTPNLMNEIIDFFSNWRLVSVPNVSGLRLPAPASPAAHVVVYTAVRQYSFVWGLWQIVILALRFVFRSPAGKKAETVSNLVFSVGAGFLLSMFLIDTTRWFVFWAAIIMLLGLSLIVRAVVLAAAHAIRST
jgi:hypothetical protein